MLRTPRIKATPASCRRDISPLAVGLEMTNELVRLVDSATGEAAYAAWLRRASNTGEVIFAGFYETCEFPGRRHHRYMKTVCPLLGGSMTVVLRPENRPDGSIALVSNGGCFGEAGYYRIHRAAAGVLCVKRMPMEEVFHVFVDAAGTLRIHHHTFALGKVRFLTLRYEITPRVS